MPIRHVDYEPASAPPQPAKVKAGFPGVKSRRPAAAKKPEPPTTKQISASRENADVPSPPAAPPDRAPDAEKAAAPAGPTAEDGPPEEQAGNAVRPGLPGAGRDFKNRFDAAQGRIRNGGQNTDELPELLDQAVTLLEALANHPAMTDYSAIKQRLDNVEQIVHSSANVR